VLGIPERRLAKRVISITGIRRSLANDAYAGERKPWRREIDDVAEIYTDAYAAEKANALRETCSCDGTANLINLLSNARGIRSRELLGSACKTTRLAMTLHGHPRCSKTHEVHRCARQRSSSLRVWLPRERVSRTSLNRADYER